MAKRQSNESLPDPFDDEFDDLGKVDPKSVEDPIIEDIDYDALTEPVGLTGGSVTSEPVSAGQVVGGTLGVVIQAVIFLVIFLAIGFGMVFAGQRIGLVPARAASVSNVAIFAVATAAATAVPVVPPTATPTLAPGEIVNCPAAKTWWNSQQVQDSFTYFTTIAMDEARGSNRIPALMENMRIRRNFVANTPMDACVEEVRAALLQAFDATIEAARAIGAGDDAALATQIDNINAAYADMQEALARVGINAESVPTIG